jgi:putative DNA methylase
MTDYPIKSPRKLIEVALPLDVINVASVRESYIYRGNPSSMHKWWAQRPLAAARAVIFSQLVNDPAGLWDTQNPGQHPNKQQRGAFTKRRKELFDLIEKLVLWENINKEEVLALARTEIRRSWREVCELNKDHPQATDLFVPDRLPALYDPFAGGGTIPLEAQRLGLEAHASDLNPVAVLINKAMIEIPPKFAGRPPVSLLQSRRGAKKKELDLDREWPGPAGLAEDVRYYGAWICEVAQKLIGHLYPPVAITAEMAKERPDLNSLVGQKLTVIAWLWARTVKSPNPAFSHVDVPLASTFILSSKAGKEVYVHPVVEGDRYHFSVKVGTPPPEAKAGTSAGRRKAFRCLISGAPIDYDYIRSAGKGSSIGQKLLAVVAESAQGRIYLSPREDLERAADEAKPLWRPDCEMPKKHRNFQPPVYGMSNLGDIFTSRQLVTFTTLSDLVIEARGRIHQDAVAAGMIDDGRSLNSGGTGAPAYADGVVSYLAFILSKMIDYNCTLVPWYAQENRPSHLFSRQAIPMVWDFVELNPLCEIGGAFAASNRIIADALAGCPVNCVTGDVRQLDATALRTAKMAIFSTDPPYYDNIAYADLSDFFYVWLRRALKPVFPELFATLAVPKTEELIASVSRHGSDEKAEAFFLEGMTWAMRRLAEQAHPAFPVTIYYAFKQSESDENSGTASTGWETFLGAVLLAGFAITGTWPMRTERSARSVGIGANALASCIILVCRKRPADAPSISRREFIRELTSVLPEALDEMTKGSGDERSPVAPVDLSQAIIGPGMAVFSKYAAVLEADGSPMSVRTALQLINRFLAEDDFDADTQFCLHWFEQHGWTESVFGEADVLARSKSTSVDAMKEAGVLQSGSGKVRLLKWAEYPTDWDPRTDARTPVWEALHQLIRALKQGGESASGALLAALGGKAEAVRQLAYRLYTLCERLGQAEDARAYNELITSWTGIETAAAAAPKPTQTDLFE